MHPEDHPADELPPTGEKTIVGVRWAVGLGAGLLIALALLTAVRWAGRPAVAEEILQIPVATATPTPRTEILAPDPGDHP